MSFNKIDLVPVNEGGVFYILYFNFNTDWLNMYDTRNDIYKYDNDMIIFFYHASTHCTKQNFIKKIISYRFL